jgi:hypothetical protein
MAATIKTAISPFSQPSKSRRNVSEIRWMLMKSKTSIRTVLNSCWYSTMELFRNQGRFC